MVVVLSVSVGSMAMVQQALWFMVSVCVGCVCVCVLNIIDQEKEKVTAGPIQKMGTTSVKKNSWSGKCRIKDGLRTTLCPFFFKEF